MLTERAVPFELNESEAEEQLWDINALSSVEDLYRAYPLSEQQTIERVFVNDNRVADILELLFTKFRITGAHATESLLTAVANARAQGIRDEETILRIGQAAALHDAGKLHIADEILKKPGRLTPEEWEIMNTHAQLGYLYLKDQGITNLPVLLAARDHHTFYDSTFSRELYGEENGIETLFVLQHTAVADHISAMKGKRLYRESQPCPQEIVEAKLYEAFPRPTPRDLYPRVDIVQSGLAYYDTLPQWTFRS